MKINHWKECQDVVVEKVPYKDKHNKVTGVSIRWLSQYGDDGHGYPEYGLRFFTAKPGGEIPIHNHFYHQTMYILTGQFECWSFDPDSDEITEKEVCGPGSCIFVPSMEPHGMKNISDTEEATFLCCICNVYEDK